MNSPIIEFLHEVEKRIHLYIDPINSEMLECFLTGFVRGVLCQDSSVNNTTYRRSKEAAIVSRGWKYSAAHPSREMITKGMSEEEVIRERLAIEIETWRILESHAPQIERG